MEDPRENGAPSPVKKLITLVLLAASFLGGYCLGRTPGAPDPRTPARAALWWVVRATMSARKLLAPREAQARPAPPRTRDEPAQSPED